MTKRSDPAVPGAYGLVKEILRKHARNGPRGGYSRCAPESKVIFESEEAAYACADELCERTLALAQYAYPCPHGEHWHLTRKPHRRRRGGGSGESGGVVGDAPDVVGGPAEGDAPTVG